MIYTILEWAFWLTALFFVGLYVRRHIIFGLVLGWHSLKEFDKVRVAKCYLKYDFYDTKQRCHFYTMYINDGDWKQNLMKCWWGSVGSTELIAGIGSGQDGDVEGLQLEFMKLDVFGAGHLRTIGDDWDD
ncbi:hypothetical protein VPHK397_0075 [Vibrio phage K397]